MRLIAFIAESEVEAAIDRMAEAITDKLADTNPLVYTVMNGGLVLAGKLLTKAEVPSGKFVHSCNPLPQ